MKEVKLEDIIHDLQELYGQTTSGKWCQGASSHETVSKATDREDYHVAHFRHARDAAFVDFVHKFTPYIIGKLKELEKGDQQ